MKTPYHTKSLKDSALRRRERAGEPLPLTLLITPTQRDTKKWRRTGHSLQGPVREVRATRSGCQSQSKKYHYKKISMSHIQQQEEQLKSRDLSHSQSVHTQWNTAEGGAKKQLLSAGWVISSGRRQISLESGSFERLGQGGNDNKA